MAEAPHTPLPLPRVAALNLPTLSNLSFRWTKLESSASGVPLRRGPFSVPIGDKIYFLGGSPEGKPADQREEEANKKILVFNTKASQWEEPIACEEPTTGYGAMDHAFPVGDSIMCNLSRNLCLIDPKTGRVTHLRDGFPSLHRTTNGQTMVLWNGKDSTVRYNCSTWKKEPAVENFGAIPYEEHSPVLFSVGENVILYSEKYPSVYIHNPQAGQWAVLPGSKPPARPGAVGFGVHRYGPLILVTCGWWGKQYGVITFNLITGQWTDHGVLPGAPQHDGVPDPALVGNKIFFWGAEKTDVVHVLHIENVDWNESHFSQFDAAFDVDVSDVLKEVQKPKEHIDEFVEDNADVSRRDIVTDAKLKPFRPERMKIHRKIEQSIPGLFSSTPVALPRFLTHNLPTEDKGNGPLPNHVFHKNMISYLVLAYDAHLSVVLSPDMVFYTLLCELADTIKSNPEMYSRLFTQTPEEKSTTFFFQKDPAEIDLDVVCDQLQASIPVDASAFRASFTTTDAASRLAMNAAFADAMGCYTFYVGGLCGIPRVRVLGSKSDWQQIEQKLEKWHSIFGSTESAKQEEDEETPVPDRTLQWIKLAQSCVRDIYTKRDPAFWKEMMTIDRCNCGTTDAITGWITRLYRCCKPHTRYGKTWYYSKDFYNFDSHISSVSWTNQENRHQYSLFTGLLYSTIEKPQTELDATYPFLKPHFAHLVRDETDMSMSDEEYQRYLAGLPWEDSVFLKEHREYMESPIVLKGGSEKIRHMHSIILEKWHKLNEAAAHGNCKPVSLSLPAFDRTFGRLDLPYDMGINREDAKRRAEIDAKYPLMRRIAEEIGKFLGSGPLESISLSNEHQMMCFSEIFLQNISQSQLKTLKMEVRDLELVSKILLASPRCLSHLSIKFACTLDASELNGPLLACKSPLKFLQIDNCNRYPMPAIYSKLAHPASPLEGFEITMGSDQRTELYNYLADHASEIRLRQLQVWLMGDSNSMLAQAKALSSFFSKNSHVESIRLSCDQPSEEARNILVNSLAQVPIKKLEAKYTSGDPLPDLIDRWHSLEDLDLTELRVGKNETFVSALVSSICNLLRSATCQLSHLSVYRCELKDAHIAQIMDAVHVGNAKYLKKVELRRNTVALGASQAIARALASPSCPIEELDLYECDIPLQGAIDIISSLENNKFLKSISWTGRKPEEEAEQRQMIEALGRSLSKNNVVEHINGPLGVADEETMRKFAVDITNNNTIQTLELDRYEAKLAQMEPVWGILRRNRRRAGNDKESDFRAFGDEADSEGNPSDEESDEVEEEAEEEMAGDSDAEGDETEAVVDDPDK
eukprot:TRINITY_DN2679_c0_g1_i1.p1 TRINITY_DN2679_c0_g1~~TRINITY_DN2679_c0_g1_i1.p1  ORF type:complete len:1318 (-),score=223.37 TRINITY_DN2679_c0_g1_i1:55-4008(-)